MVCPHNSISYVKARDWKLSCEVVVIINMIFVFSLTLEFNFLGSTHGPKNVDVNCCLQFFVIVFVYFFLFILGVALDGFFFWYDTGYLMLNIFSVLNISKTHVEHKKFIFT